MTVAYFNVTSSEAHAGGFGEREVPLSEKLSNPWGISQSILIHSKLQSLRYSFEMTVTYFNVTSSEACAGGCGEREVPLSEKLFHHWGISQSILIHSKLQVFVTPSK
jgi:hypothetical protein